MWPLMRRAATRRLWAVVLATALAPGVAYGQQPDGAGPARAEEAAGEPVQVVVFSREGQPLAGARVEIAGRVLEANEQGAVHLDLAPGRYRLQVEAPGQEVALLERLDVGAGGAEVVVTLAPDGAAQGGAQFDVESGATREADVAPDGEGGGQAQQEELGPPGWIVGVVRTVEGDRPVAGASVYVRGQPVEGTTDAQGRFRIEVPAGRHDVSVLHPEYSTGKAEAVEVPPGEETEAVVVGLEPSMGLMAEIFVPMPVVEGGTATLLEGRQEAATMDDVIGAEDFSRAGDSDAAAALKRVTGLTVVGGKYVYIRGMGERYVGTLLNGAVIPSPDPERQVVPLDMIPTGLIESITIQKTYSPDMPGNFGGGVIKLETRKPPKEFEAQLSASVGVNTQVTFQPGLVTRHPGSLDWLGFDDGARQLPEEVRQAAEEERLVEGGNVIGQSGGYTAEELERLGEQLPNNWALREALLPPGVGLSGVVGDSTTLWGVPVGARLGLSYDHDWSSFGGTRVFLNNELEPQSTFDLRETRRQITTSGILSLVVEPSPGDILRLTSLIARISDDAIQQFNGFDNSESETSRLTRLGWLERQLSYHQLAGEHTLDSLWNLGVAWTYVYGQASREEPDLKQHRYDLEATTGRYQLSDLPEGNSRIFATAVDHTHNLLLDVTKSLPGIFGGERVLELKSGAQLVVRDREADVRRFKFNTSSNPSPELATQPPERLFVPANIGPGGVFRFAEFTRGTDYYEGEQLVVAGYAMAVAPVTEWLELVGGARVESLSQRVVTFDPFAARPTEDAAELSALDALPMLGLTWSLDENMQVRAAVSRTVNRPDFREQSPAVFEDITGAQTRGNAELNRALITHGDLRWEWYPRPGESLSVAGFYKDFTDPIETNIVPGATPTYTWENVAGAQNLGLEVETRRNLDVLFDGDLWRDLFVSLNGALIWSRVDFYPEQATVLTSTTRPLQGQSPYVLNVQGGYDGVETGLNVTVLYNVFGSRIVDVGTRGLPDTYERPFHQLDVVASQRLGNWGFKASARNLLDPVVRFTQGDQRVYTYQRGREFSISVSHDW